MPASPAVPTNAAPLQYAAEVVLDAPISSGAAATGVTVQKDDAGLRGRTMPVTTSVCPSVCRRAPTCRPNLAAVAVLTATWNVAALLPRAVTLPGMDPATSVALRARPLRYISSITGGAPVYGGRPPVKPVEPLVRPSHC